MSWSSNVAGKLDPNATGNYNSVVGHVKKHRAQSVDA